MFDEWKLRVFWWKIEKWFYDNTPVICIGCGETVRRKNTVNVTALTGPTFGMCKTCHKIHFSGDYK